MWQVSTSELQLMCLHMMIDEHASVVRTYNSIQEARKRVCVYDY